MTIRDWQHAILARLRTVFDEDQVYEWSVPDDQQLPSSNGVEKPYVVLWWGQRVSGAPGNDALTGVLGSAHRMTFVTQVIAPTGSMAEDARAAVSSLLLGFRPVGQGELREDGAATLRTSLDISGVRAKNQVPLAYSGLIDL